MKNFKERLHAVKAFAFDVDGVFTDGSVMVHPSGELVRVTNARDGFAVMTAVKHGYPIAIITGGTSEVVKERFQTLGVMDIYLGSTDKEDSLEDFRFKYGLELDEIVYMGDDIPDYGVMKKVGFPTCPADAATEILNVAMYISNYGGGKGCVRDIIEQVLKLKGLWPNGENK